MVLHFDVARDKSVASIENAVKENGKIFLVAQQDAYIENPGTDDLYEIGVVAEIKQILKLPENVVKVLVEGLYKAKLIRLFALK